MNRPQQLARIAEISAMHRRRAASRLETAARLEQQRKTMAADSRTAQADATRQAETYVARKFQEMTPDVCSSAFLSSLTLGHRQATSDAVAAAVRADRLTVRHDDAVKMRAEQARALLWAEQVMNQRFKLVDDAVAAALCDIDTAEEAEAQDIHAGKVSQ